MGVQHFISYYLGRKDPDAIGYIIKKMGLVSVLLGIFAFIVTWVSAPLFAVLFFHSSGYTIYLQLLSIALIAQVVNSIIFNMLLGLQKFKANAIRNIVASSLAYGSIIPLLYLNYNPLMILVGWNIGYFTGTVLTTIYLAGKVKNIESKHVENVKIKPIFYYSIPLFISSLLGYGATYVDRFTVSYFLSLSEMGIYNFSLLIVSALSSIIAPFPAILLPKLSEYYGKGDYATMKMLSSKAIEVMMAVYLPLALLVAAISPSILLFLANKDYLPGFIPIIIILVVNSIFISSNVLAVSLQAVRKTRIFLLSSSLALLSNLILSIMLIPRYGIVGAGIAFSSIYVVVFAILFYYSKRYDTVTIERLKIAKILLSGFLMFFIMFLVQEHLGYSILKLFFYIISGLVIYILIIRVTKTFYESDLDLFLSLFSDRYILIKKLIRKILI